MPARTYSIDDRLSLAPAGVGRQNGVIVFEEYPYDVPRGANISVWVTRPYELIEAGVPSCYAPLSPPAAPVSSQKYKFETAPLPAAYSILGVNFRTRNRTLTVSSSAPVFGPFSTRQEEPVWADFSPVQSGDIERGGEIFHSFQMDDLSGVAPEAETEKRLLRFRYVGTVVAVPAAIGNPGGNTYLNGSAWASGHRNLVPGSIVVTLPTSLGTLRDTGYGKLVGQHGDGDIDYQTGEFKLNFAAAETGNVVAVYEHDCGYHPLDVHVEWNSTLV